MASCSNLKSSLSGIIPATSFLSQGPTGTSSVWLHVNTANNIEQWSFQQPLKLASKALLCLHRWKVWWIIPRVVQGQHPQGRVPSETYLLVAKNFQDEFVVMISTIDQDMSFSLEGGCHRQETGSEVLLLLNGFKNAAKATSMSQDGMNTRAMLIITGTNLNDTVETGYNIIRSQLRGEEYIHAEKATQSVVDNHYRQVKRKGPQFANYLGWCTWDSCYTNLSQGKVEAALQSFAKAGVTPRFLILDDGWQDTNVNDCNNGHQWQGRLKSCAANFKFAPDYVPSAASDHGPRIVRQDVPDHSNLFDLSQLVKDVKKKYNIESFLVWHALAGYWLGVDPTSPHLQAFDVNVEFPHISPSVLRMSKDGKLKDEAFNHQGIGVIPPKQVKGFYDEYHQRLKAMGVDGVKVDVQSAIPLMQHSDHSSWAATLHYHEGLQHSIQRHFSTQGKEAEHSIIHCMSHSHETMLAILAKYDSNQAVPIIRGSDDYWPTEDASHAPHVFANAMNSLMMNQFGLHDWDMFRTDMGKPSMFHAAARAVSGGPVYVSDKADTHDPTVLHAMALSNGLIPRCLRNARPVQNLLFEDPQRTVGIPLLLQNINPAGGLIVAGFHVFGSVVENDGELYRKVSATEIFVPDCRSSILIDNELVDDHSINFEVQATMVDECQAYLEKGLESVHISTDCVASGKEYICHSYRMQSLQEIIRSSSVAMYLPGSFDFEVLSFSPKHYFRGDPSKWIAVVGNVALLNPGGSIEAVDLVADLKNKKMAVRVGMMGNSNRCSIGVSLALRNAKIQECFLKLHHAGDRVEVDATIINLTQGGDSFQHWEVFVEEKKSCISKNVLQTMVVLEFDM